MSQSVETPQTRSRALRIVQDVPIRFTYPVYFVHDLFGERFSEIEALFEADGEHGPRKVLFVVDDGVVAHHPDLLERIQRLSDGAGGLWTSAGAPLVVPGGERAKNDPSLVEAIHARVNERGICRHSYVITIGGGAVLDLAGYAAATAHR